MRKAHIGTHTVQRQRHEQQPHFQKPSRVTEANKGVRQQVFAVEATYYMGAESKAPYRV